MENIISLNTDECSHCSRQLVGYQRSSELPYRDNHYYIACKSCGAVHIAYIVDGVIYNVEATPNDNYPDSVEMMKEAYALFLQEGVNILSYKFDSSDDKEEIDVLFQTRDKNTTFTSKGLSLFSRFINRIRALFTSK